MGCEEAGVFKSEDGGQSWAGLPLPNPFPQTSQVWKLALDPAAPDTIYLATNGAGVFKSVDGGQTWMDVNNGLPPLSRVDTFVAARGTVYSGTDGSGVFKTVDGGANWIAMNHGLRAATVLAVAVDPVTPSTVYAGIATGGVFKSQDAGATWMAKNEGLTWPAGGVVEALAIDPMIPTTVYAVGVNFNSTVFKTGDGGGTWRAVTGPFDPTRVALAIDPIAPSTLYRSSSDGAGLVDKSVDGGESWAVLDGPPVAVTQVAVSPRTPGVVYTGTLDGVYRSEDGGASWTRASRGLPDSVSLIDGSVRTAAVDVLAFGPESPSTLYAVAAFYSPGHFSRAVFRSTDAGETWTAAGRGLEDTLVNTLAADPVVPGRLFAGTEDGGVFLSEDAGMTWTAMSAGLTGAPVEDLALSTGSPATLWAATYGSGVFDFQLPRFADVSPASGFSAWIDALASAGITAGCATQPPRYCPEASTTRAQMAILLLRSLNGPGATPPAATGTMFADVAATSFAAAWIERLAALGLSEGCGQGNYCPDELVTRAQMATLLLRATHGRGYLPPPPTGAVFQDVPATHPFASWIEQLAREGITASCGTQPARYCPEDAVTRGQIAVFLVRAFHLPM